jgi:two-component system, LuxR family, response regulator FixJ
MSSQDSGITDVTTTPSPAAASLRKRGRRKGTRTKRKNDMPRPPSVFVLDDDGAEVEAMSNVLVAEGFACDGFTVPQQCLESVKVHECDVLITDLLMPGHDGIEVLCEAICILPELPVIVVTGHGNIPLAVVAMKKGAKDFIEKPVDKDALLRSVRGALGDVEKKWSAAKVQLSRTERVVLKHVLQGNGNKHIAFMMGRSIRTIEDHRSHLMKKLNAENVVDLVRRSIELGLA